MRYSVFAGGKRLRPVLTLAAADAVARHRSGHARRHAAGEPGASPASLALPAACAIELIHTYSLIHDDLPAMDNDTLRRGRPTLHVVYGDGIAILAGDGLQAEAFALLAREPADDDPAIVARKLRVDRGRRRGGGPGRHGRRPGDRPAGRGSGAGTRASTLDADGLRAMHARKTGALIRASAVSGAIMAGAADDLVDGRRPVRGRDRPRVSDRRRHPRRRRRARRRWARPPARTPPARSRPIRRSSASRARARWPPNALERAHAALDEAGLTDGWLGPIADWVVTRKS